MYSTTTACSPSNCQQTRATLDKTIAKVPNVYSNANTGTDVEIYATGYNSSLSVFNPSATTAVTVNGTTYTYTTASYGMIVYTTTGTQIPLYVTNTSNGGSVYALLIAGGGGGGGSGNNAGNLDYNSNNADLTDSNCPSYPGAGGGGAGGYATVLSMGANGSTPGSSAYSPYYIVVGAGGVSGSNGGGSAIYSSYLNVGAGGGAAGSYGVSTPNYATNGSGKVWCSGTGPPNGSNACLGGPGGSSTSSSSQISGGSGGFGASAQGAGAGPYFPSSGYPNTAGVDNTPGSFLLTINGQQYNIFFGGGGGGGGYGNESPGEWLSNYGIGGLGGGGLGGATPNLTISGVSGQTGSNASSSLVSWTTPVFTNAFTFTSSYNTGYSYFTYLGLGVQVGGGGGGGGGGSGVGVGSTTGWPGGYGAQGTVVVFWDFSQSSIPLQTIECPVIYNTPTVWTSGATNGSGLCFAQSAAAVTVNGTGYYKWGGAYGMLVFDGTASAWVQYSNVPMYVLVVGGGGCGGNGSQNGSWGGGGASGGEIILTTITPNGGSPYNTIQPYGVYVGQGGNGAPGGNSGFGSVVASGGPPGTNGSSNGQTNYGGSLGGSAAGGSGGNGGQSPTNGQPGLTITVTIAGSNYVVQAGGGGGGGSTFGATTTSGGLPAGGTGGTPQNDGNQNGQPGLYQSTTWPITCGGGGGGGGGGSGTSAWDGGFGSAGIVILFWGSSAYNLTSG